MMTGTNYQKMINIITPEIDELLVATRQIKTSFQVDNSRGKSLDQIGEILEFSRIIGELDNSYRERLSNITYVNTIAGTKNSIKQLLANFLRIDEKDVTIKEIVPGYIIIQLPLFCETNDSAIKDMIYRAVAAGIQVSVYYGGTYWDVVKWDDESTKWG